jgi:predicted Zn finger-like uncharacterized protein
MLLHCPGCRSSLSIPDGLADRTVRCKYCNETFRPAEVDGGVPTLEPAEPVRVRPLSATPPPTARPAPTRREPPPAQARRRSLRTLWLLIPFGLVALLGAALAIGALVMVIFDHGSSSQAAGGGSPIGQAETLPPETLERLKAMTVFVKVDAGMLQASGSGFLIKTDAQGGFVVTNNHVANPRDDEPERGPFGPRFGPAFRRPANPRITVVLHSGTEAERSVPARLFIADAEDDLAILRIEAEQLPQPLDLMDHADLAETMPVFILGYPFGEQLGLKRNPAVNVGKATVTSIRRDRANKPALVQLQGELHPGNSGGPVVDAQGRLIGVAVSKVRGTQIGFAIAPTVLEDLLRRGR